MQITYHAESVLLDGSGFLSGSENFGGLWWPGSSCAAHACSLTSLLYLHCTVPLQEPEQGHLSQNFFVLPLYGPIFQLHPVLSHSVLAGLRAAWLSVFDSCSSAPVPSRLPLCVKRKTDTFIRKVQVQKQALPLYSTLIWMGCSAFIQTLFACFSLT